MKWEDRDGSSNVLVSGGKAVGGGIGSIVLVTQQLQVM